MANFVSKKLQCQSNIQKEQVIIHLWYLNCGTQVGTANNWQGGPDQDLMEH